MLGVKPLLTATKMIAEVEVMHMIKKGQLKLKTQSVHNQNRCIHQLCRLTA